MSDHVGDEERVLRVLARPFKNTAEPAQGRVYDEMIRSGHVVEELSLKRLVTSPWDIAHVHYPEGSLRRAALAPSLIAVVVLATILILCRVKGVRVVGTGHNTKSHEGHHPKLERIVMAMFDRSVDAMTYPTDTARSIVVANRDRLVGLPAEVVPLSNYRWERTSIERSDARATWQLSDDSVTLLFVGLIRPYKNVPALIEAVRSTRNPNVVLIVAGNPGNPEIEAAVRAAADGDPRVTLELRYIEADEVSSLMSAADLVVLPFTAVLNSASTLLGISHDRPVMVPQAGSLRELAERSGPAWFHFFEGDISGEQIDVAVDEMDSRAASRHEPPDLRWCDVETIAAQTTEFYASLVG